MQCRKYITVIPRYSNTFNLSYYRISQFLLSRFDIPIIYSKETAEPYLDGRYNVIYGGEGLGYCMYIKDMLCILKNAHKIYWINNDFRITPERLDKRLLKIFQENPPYILTSSIKDGQNTNHAEYVHFGIVGYNPTVDITSNKMEHEGLFHFGAFKLSKVPYFQRYLDTELYPVTVSLTREKDRSKFVELLKHQPVYTHSIKTWKDLCGYPATVYTGIAGVNPILEHDEVSTRFYEALSVGMAIAIHHEAIPAFCQDQIAIPAEFIVSDDYSMKKFIDHSEKYRVWQQDLWRKDYGSILENQLSQILFGGSKCR